MNVSCVLGRHEECADSMVDTGACSCPCHLKGGGPHQKAPVRTRLILESDIRESNSKTKAKSDGPARVANNVGEVCRDCGIERLDWNPPCETTRRPRRHLWFRPANVLLTDDQQSVEEKK